MLLSMKLLPARFELDPVDTAAKMTRGVVVVLIAIRENETSTKLPPPVFCAQVLPRSVETKMPSPKYESTVLSASPVPT